MASKKIISGRNAHPANSLENWLLMNFYRFKSMVESGFKCICGHYDKCPCDKFLETKNCRCRVFIYVEDEEVLKRYLPPELKIIIEK